MHPEHHEAMPGEGPACSEPASGPSLAWSIVTQTPEC